MNTKRPYTTLGLILAAGAANAWRNRRRGPATVVYDGACPLCVAAVDRLRGWDAGGVLRYADARAAGGESPREMRLEFPDGRSLGGFDAARALCLLLPRLRPLAPLLFVPGIRTPGALAYRLVARFRPIPGRCQGGSCARGK
ncbi:MAG TPA: DCC1-like thiol-disulfide oxidoreductase family protein [Armatimonadota bacterium]|jgi:predicted DCC family thiol-disulfide oxidoreductase YuxK